MKAPNGLSVRTPAVAGRFYPADAGQCRAAVLQMLQTADAGPTNQALGAIVPHAGWVCSGAIAGQTIATLAAMSPVDCVVVFGAVHTPGTLDRAAMDPHQAWCVPTGVSTQPTDVISRLGKESRWFTIDRRLHDHEHAVEVELPFIQLAWPGAEVLPVEVPLIDDAPRIGQETAEQIFKIGRKVIFLASSDLTHYGSAYRFAPAGIGETALQWAKENDRRLLDLVTDLAADKIVPEVNLRHNACGAGAIAAMLAACKFAGAKSATILRHASSYETLRGIIPPDLTNAVGYAGVLVGK